MYVEYMRKAPKNPARQILPFAFPGMRAARRKSQEIRSILRNILVKHRKKSNPNTKTIIAMICNNPEYKDDEERVRDLFGYMVGGFDTTSYSLAWTLLELARHPEEQKYLRAELLQCNNTKDELYNCVALKHVIRESLRLHPTASLGSSRVTAKDFPVPGDGNYYIPAGSIVDMPFFAIHRDQDVFKQADEFIPKRWDCPSDDATRAIMGFSLGSRGCQGRMVADVELMVILAELCSKYKFSVVDEGHVEYCVTYKPVGSLLNVTKL